MKEVEVQQPGIGNSYTLCPFQIQMCDLKGGIGLGTAFFYDYQDKSFIITNWHNVTGKNPFTGKPLNSVRSPLFIKAKWPVFDQHNKRDDGTRMGYFTAQKIEIEDCDGSPLWYEHPSLGSLCDVIALPCERPADWHVNAHKPANRIDQHSIPIEPGLKVMVIGFPAGMSTGPGLPLMKTGFLSSMPGYSIRLDAEFSDTGGMKGGFSIGDAMFVDVHTVEGMSGSPVFGEYSGIWGMGPGEVLSDDTHIGTGRRFLGCHSSRLWRQKDRAGLGICYPSSVIDEICRTKRVGSRFPRSDNDTGITYA